MRKKKYRRNPRCMHCNKKLKNCYAIRCKKHNAQYNNAMKGKFGKNNGHWDRVERKCDWCDNIILVTHTRNKQKHTFCSKDCRSKWAKIYYKNFNNLKGQYPKYGKDNPNYSHGRGNKPYPLEFNNTLRNKIRKRDNYQCQGENCSMTQEEHFITYGRDLEVHHIEYNKFLNKEKDLITLCKQCHIRARHNRKYWQEYYIEKINDIYSKIDSMRGNM